MQAKYRKIRNDVSSIGLTTRIMFVFY